MVPDLLLKNTKPPSHHYQHCTESIRMTLIIKNYIDSNKTNPKQFYIYISVVIIGSEEESVSDKPKDSQLETGEESHDSENSQSETSESEEKSEEKPTEPYIERMFEFQPLQPVGEGNQFNMKTGTQKVKLHINIDTAQAKPYPPTITDNGIINLKTLPDGTKQLLFNLENIKIETGAAPGIEQIYEQVLDTLQTKTNFEQLKYKSRYLSSLLALLEAAYYGVKYENEHVKTLFNEMANELEIVNSDELESDEIEESETPIQEIDQSEVEEAGFGQSSEQFENVLHSTEEVQYSYQEEPKVQIIEQGGMRIKVTSRNVKEGSESYADEQDFEEGVNQFVEEVRLEEINKETSEKSDVENLGLPEEDSSDLVEEFEGQGSDVISGSAENIGTGTSVSSIKADTESIGDSTIDSDSTDFDRQSTMSNSDVTEMQNNKISGLLQQESNIEGSVSQEGRTEHTEGSERKLTYRQHGDP